MKPPMPLILTRSSIIVLFFSYTGSSEQIFQFFWPPFGDLASPCHFPNGEKISLSWKTLCDWNILVSGYWCSTSAQSHSWPVFFAKDTPWLSWRVALSINRNQAVPVVPKWDFAAVKVFHRAWSWCQPFQEILTRKEIRKGNSSLLYLVHWLSKEQIVKCVIELHA